MYLYKFIIVIFHLVFKTGFCSNYTSTGFCFLTFNCRYSVSDSDSGQDTSSVGQKETVSQDIAVLSCKCLSSNQSY